MSKVISVSLLLLYAGCTYGQKAEVFATQDGAIGGYDPVAYFMSDTAVKGEQQYMYQWKGAGWYFTSQKNLDTFKANPEQYAPKYGGYCAYAVSQGYTAQVDPNAWRIVKGKLYLNYNADVQKMWEEKQQEYIEQANMHWPQVLTKENE